MPKPAWRLGAARLETQKAAIAEDSDLLRRQARPARHPAVRRACARRWIRPSKRPSARPSARTRTAGASRRDREIEQARRSSSVAVTDPDGSPPAGDSPHGRVSANAPEHCLRNYRAVCWGIGSIDEEDKGGVRAYRPASYKFPPSRGRDGLEFRARGELVSFGILRDDGSESLLGLGPRRSRPVRISVKTPRFRPFDLAVRLLRSRLPEGPFS